MVRFFESAHPPRFVGEQIVFPRIIEPISDLGNFHPID